MAVDINKLAFFSNYAIDKIVVSDSVSETIAATTATIKQYPNTYGKKAFITIAWSVDNTNFYPPQAYTDLTLLYTVNGWCDANYVYIYYENNTGGNVTFTVNYVLDTIL